MKYTEKEIQALIRVVEDDLKKYKDNGKEWQLGYLSALLRLESYLTSKEKN